MERIARELRKIRSKSNIRDASKSRPTTILPKEYVSTVDTQDLSMSTPSTGRGLRLKRSLKNMRSNGALREKDGNSRSSTRPGDGWDDEMPAFDAEEMKRNRMIWEAQQKKKGKQPADIEV